jgi:hypothetical protein
MKTRTPTRTRTRRPRVDDQLALRVIPSEVSLATFVLGLDVDNVCFCCGSPLRALTPEAEDLSLQCPRCQAGVSAPLWSNAARA